MSLIVQASRKANEYSLTAKENRIFNRNLEALKYNELAKAAAAAAAVASASSSPHSAVLSTAVAVADPSAASSSIVTAVEKGKTTATTTTPIGSQQQQVQQHLLDHSGDGGGGADEAGKQPSQQHRRYKKPYSLQICAKLVRFAFSNVGLIAAVFIYSTLGALMFQLLEQHEELRLCEEGKGKFIKELKQCRENILLYVIYNSSTNQLSSLGEARNLTRFSRSSFDPLFTTLAPPLSETDLEAANYSLESLWAAKSTTYTPTIATTVSYGNNEYPLIDSLLVEFRRKIIEIQTNTSYYGQNCQTDSKWSLFSSLLFTITTVSTVGYGFIAPLTWEGRVVSVCYASMGIPIFLLCLAHLSSALGKMFKFIYAKFAAINPIGLYLKRRRREGRLRRRAKKGKGVLNLSKKDLSPKNIMVLQDGQSILTKSELSSNMMLSAGGAAAAARERDMEEFNLAYELMLEPDVHLGGGEDDEMMNDDDDDDDDEDDDEDDDYFYDMMEGEVPVSLAIFVIVLYMSAGAWIFHTFEGWSYSKSFYFSYGFGDLVPGLKPNDKYASLKKLTVCFYSLFGMAIIGMCFNVMQFVARRKIMWLFGRLKRLSTCCKKKSKKVGEESSGGGLGDSKARVGPIKDMDTLTDALIEKEKEKEAIMHRLKLLQQLESQLNAKKRRRMHVLH